MMIITFRIKYLHFGTSKTLENVNMKSGDRK